IWLLFFSVPVQAETMYVSDIVKITLRTGPGADHRVLGMLQSGQEVEVLKTEDEWAQVKLAGGKEGWVLRSLLTSDKPKILLLDQTTEKNKALIHQVSDLINKNNRLTEVSKGLENELAQLKIRIQETGQAYETLQKDSSEFLALQSKYKQSAQELDAQIKKANELEVEIGNLKSNHNIKWFLIGAGVLLLGFLLGLSAKRQRRRYMVL
ncbi:MAG: TIGR04211 family SH3 domain-containing protein, partial [Thermodesulfobacteriota bacterium]